MKESTTKTSGFPLKQHHYGPRTVVWHQGIGPHELILRVAAPMGVTPGSRLLIFFGFDGQTRLEGGHEQRNFVGSEASAELEAERLGRAWIRANHPDAQIRVRSSLERRILFGDKPTRRTWRAA